MKWPVLSNDDRYNLRVSRSQANKGYIVFCHSQNDTEYVHENIFPVLKKDGFTVIDGVIVKEAMGLNPALLREAFPDIYVAEYSNKELGTFSADHRWIKSVISNVKLVAKNKNADQVVESFEGHRFLRGEDALTSGTAGELLTWDGKNSEVFRDCMDAFVLQIAQESGVKKFSDLERFATQITGKPKEQLSELMRPIQEGLESALLRYQQVHGGLDRDGLDLSYVLHSRQPIFEARTSSSVILQQYSTPMHFNVIVQRILGDVEQKNILEPTIGNASLVSQLPVSNNVFGADLDDQRLGQAGLVRPDAQVHHADATTVDFRSWLGADAAQGFDVVVANPPFGALEKKVRFDDKINVSKIDHLILLRSLAARSDTGTGVYIIGADSYIDNKAGEISGTSKYLLNYLQDHYELDVIEVPGNLYARQGASFPIRMLVIGDRLPVNKIGTLKQIDIEQPLPLVSTIDGLWEWSETMRNKYGLANDVMANPFNVAFADVNAEFNRFNGSVVEYNVSLTFQGKPSNLPVPPIQGNVIRVMDNGNTLEVLSGFSGEMVKLQWEDVAKVIKLVDNVKNPIPDDIGEMFNGEELAPDALITNERDALFSGVYFQIQSVGKVGDGRPQLRLINAVTGEDYSHLHYISQHQLFSVMAMRRRLGKLAMNLPEDTFLKMFNSFEPSLPDVSRLAYSVYGQDEAYSRADNSTKERLAPQFAKQLIDIANRITLDQIESVKGINKIAETLGVTDYTFAGETLNTGTVPEPTGTHQERFSLLSRTLLSEVPVRVVDDMKTALDESALPAIPPHWIVMNAARPLVGDKTMEGEFVAGRFYAAFDPADRYAAQWVDTNLKLDARVVVPMSRTEQVETVLHNHQYEEAYREYTDADELYKMLSPKGAFHDEKFSKVMEMWDGYQAGLALGGDRLTVAELEEEQRYQAEKNKVISSEIYRQLGQMAFNKVTGAKNMTVVTNGLQFSLPNNPGYVLDRINQITITLAPSDTYTIEAARVRPYRGNITKTVISTSTDVYNDGLLDTIERITGLAVRMPRITNVQPQPVARPEPRVSYEEMLSDALKWRGAAQNAAIMIDAYGDEAAQNERARLTSKEGLDSYLIRKFGIANYEASNLSSAAGMQDADITATPDDFINEQWAVIALNAKRNFEANQITNQAVPNSFEEMVVQALKWRGAAFNADLMLAEFGDDTRLRMQHNNLTLKSELDSYLMRQFGIEEAHARDVSNVAGQREADMTSTPEHFSKEKWAEIALSEKRDFELSQEATEMPVVDEEAQINEAVDNYLACYPRYAASISESLGIANDLINQPNLVYSDIIKVKSLMESTVEKARASSLFKETSQALTDLGANDRHPRIQEFFINSTTYRDFSEVLNNMNQLNGDLGRLLDSLVGAEGKRRLEQANSLTSLEIAVAVFMSHGIDLSRSSAGVERLVEAIESQDLEEIKSRVHLSTNKASMEVFHRLTGVKLSNTIKARMAQIDEWGGISPEERQRLNEAADAASQVKALATELTESWEDVNAYPSKITYENKALTLGEFIGELHDKGFEPQAVKKGAVNQFYLVSPNGSSNIYLKKDKTWNRFVKATMAFGDGTLGSAMMHLGEIKGAALEQPSAAIEKYTTVIKEAEKIPPALVAEIQGNTNLSKDEKAQLITLIDERDNKQTMDASAADAMTQAYLDDLLTSLKPFSVENVDVQSRLKKSDFDLTNNGEWFAGTFNGSTIQMTNNFVLLDNIYPSEITTLLRHNKFDVGTDKDKDVTVWLDQLLINDSIIPLSIVGNMTSKDASPAIVVLTDKGGDVHLVDEPLIRVALGKYPEARFSFNQGMIEIMDLNDETIGFVRPLNSPSKLVHAEFYDQIGPRLLALREDETLEVDGEPEVNKSNSKTAPRLDNSFQAPYEAASKLAESSSMIPLNLKTPLMNALNKLQEEHGNIDEFVAKKLEWTIPELAKHLSPEQIDAVALGITAFEKNRGLLEGDQTGLGKGRVMAAMARYSALNGYNTMFFTETPTLFSDLWRDIQDIGSESIFTPFIMNDGVSVFDVITGKKIFKPTSATERKAVLESGAFPEGANLVVATYTQFNRNLGSSKKSRWLSTASEGAFLLMDESHNAAGNSNTGANFQTAVSQSKGVIYSSATAMKNASNVMIYSKLFPDTVDLGSMPETLAAGGQVLQEMMSAMLCEDGVFIRREHDLSNLVMTTVVDHTRKDRNRVLSDKLASILELMNYLSGDIKEIISDRNKEIKKILDSIPEDERKGNRMGAINVNFGSRLFALYRQFLMSVKVDETVDRAKKAVAAGQKPVIILENTMESLLNEVLFNKEYAAGEGSEADGEDNVPNADIEEDIKTSGIELRNPTFRDVLTRMLERISYYQETDRYGDVRKIPVISEGALNLIYQIEQEIATFPDLSASPIDDIVNRLAEDGIFCDELSGRKTKLIKQGDSHFATRIIEREKATIVSDFNAGKSDAIILSRSGSTGISLHASEKFKDSRQRVMVELQAAADVNKRVQFFGRVNRKGQISNPIIETISSGLIGESRPIAMQNAKLRQLSANTTSNQDNAALDADVPDFLNELGNKIALRYLEQNPSIAMRLDIDPEDDKSMTEYPFINKLTSRIVMLKESEQEMIYDELTTAFITELNALEAKGENPLKSRELDISARTVEREEETSGNPFSDSVFDAPIYYNKIEYTEKLNPYRAEQVEKMIEGGKGDIKFAEINPSHLPMAEFIPALATMIAANKNTYLESAMSKRFKTIDEALADEESNAVQKTNERVDFIAKSLPDLLPGSPVMFTGDDGERVKGIVTRLTLPISRGQLHQTGKYVVSIVAPGMMRAQDRSLFGLMEDSHFVPKSRMTDNMASIIMHDIDNAPKGERIMTRSLLDGNMFGAAQRAVGMGGSVIYTDSDGNRQRGLMLNSDVDKKTLRSMPIRLENAAIASEIIKRGISVSDAPNLSSRPEDQVKMSWSSGYITLAVPGTVSRGGHIFKDKDLVKLLGDFTGNRTKMAVSFTSDQLEPVLEVLYKSKGISFYASPNERERIEEIKMEAYANKSYDSGKPSLKAH